MYNLSPATGGRAPGAIFEPVGAARPTYGELDTLSNRPRRQPR
ncbi:hypothetical protein [Microbulbifer halophilus]